MSFIIVNGSFPVPDGKYCWKNDGEREKHCRFINHEDYPETHCVMFDQDLKQVIIKQGPRIGQDIGYLKCDLCKSKEV